MKDQLTRQRIKSKPSRPTRSNRPPISEDEADAIVSRRRLKTERRYSLDQILRENGFKLER